MKKNYVIDDVYRNSKQNNAGYKARDDINDILKNEFEITYFLKGNNKISRLINYLKIIWNIKLHSNIVLVQYPFYIKKIYVQLLKHWLPRGSILLIHDIDSLRNQLSMKDIDREIEIFNLFDYVISHNTKMTSWLEKNGCKSKIVNLEIFDYLTLNKIDIMKKRENAIAFAGNLSQDKSGFLYQSTLNHINLNAYGSNFKDLSLQHINYKGSFSAELLPEILNEKYGLIWDGKSIENCDGLFGEYLKYNNPHKTSLYLVSGLPVIVWDKAAIASFIENNGLGFSIQSINEIEEKLKNISKEDYLIMLNNVYKISEKLQQGYFLKKALNECREGKYEV